MGKYSDKHNNNDEYFNKYDKDDKYEDYDNDK